MASSVVQGSVANAANSLTGLAVQAPLEMPDQLFQSAGLPFDARVSEKLRAKIWSNDSPLNHSRPYKKAHKPWVRLAARQALALFA